jgi:hypothetical protein
MQSIVQLVLILASLCTALLVLLYMVRWAKKQLYFESFVASLAKVKPRFYT